MYITSKSITLVHISFQRFRPILLWIYHYHVIHVPQIQHFLLPSHPFIPILSPAFPETENDIFIPPIAKPNLELELLSPLFLYNHTIYTCYWSGSPNISWNHLLSPIFKSICLVSATIFSHFIILHSLSSCLQWCFQGQFQGQLTCAAHRAPHSKEPLPWYYALLSPPCTS